MVDLYMIICIIKVITLQYKGPEFLLKVYKGFHGMPVWNLHVPDLRLTVRKANYLQDLSPLFM